MIAKTYRDDEYYTTEEAATKFFELVVAPSGILKHKVLLMPFTTIESPLYTVATQYHNNIITFTGDMDLWKWAIDYEDIAVVDNPPFSLSAQIEIITLIEIFRLFYLEVLLVILNLFLNSPMQELFMKIANRELHLIGELVNIFKAMNILKTTIPI